MTDTLSEFGDELIGKVFQDRFEIVQGIGGGGMGAVYLARQLSIDRDVAVKVLRRGLPENAKTRFMREARTVSEMSHPGIVQMIDFGTEGDLCFLVMELVDGVPLDRLLEQGRLHPTLALVIIDQIAAGLAEAHSRGVIHRDLKPGNILLTVTAGGEPQAKLLDFGIAFSEADPRLTQSGTLCGTPAYMAPEQAQGREVTPETDFYALGVNLYEMLSGRLPFYAKSPVGVLIQHLQQKPPTLRAHADVGVLPFAAVRLSERLLKKEKANRPPNARALRKLVAESLATFGNPNLIVEGRPKDAFQEFILPALTENPHVDAANAVSFVDSDLGRTTSENESVQADVPTARDTLPSAASNKSLPQIGQVPVQTSENRAPDTLEGAPSEKFDVRPGAAPAGSTDAPGERAWAAFAEAPEATTGHRDPKNIDPNLWSVDMKNSMASFSENSIEFQIPSDFYSIEPHDTQTRERNRLAFAATIAPSTEVASKGKQSRDEKRPDWLQSAQESMELEINQQERLKPALPPEPDELPDLPPEEMVETKLASNILFILLTVALVAGMAFIGMELFVKPVKLAPNEPREKFDYSGVLKEDHNGAEAGVEEVDRFPPTQIRRKDDPERRIGPKGEPSQKEKDNMRREKTKEQLRNIEDIRYRAPIEIFESDGVKKSTREIQEL